MELGKLKAQHRARRQQRLDDRGYDRMMNDKFMNAVLELDRANDTDFKSKIAQRAAEIVLDIVNLPLQKLTRGKQKSSMLAGRRLDMHRFE